MSTQSHWIYIKEGRDHGPVSFAHLQSLYDTGQLTGADLVRPEGSPEHENRPLADVLLQEPPVVRLPATAGASQPEGAETSANEPADGEGQPAEGDEAAKASLDWIKGKVDAWTTAASITARRGVLQARRYRVAHSQLPTAYLNLGRVLRDRGQYRDEFTELYQELDDLAEEVAQLDPDEASNAEFPSLVDQIRTFASRLTGYPQREMLASHARTVLRELGRRAYEKFGDAAGPEHLVAEIRRSQKRLERLDNELKGLETEEHHAGAEARRAAADSLRKLVDTGRALVEEVPRSWSRARAQAEHRAKQRQRDEMDQGAGI